MASTSAAQTATPRRWTRRVYAHFVETGRANSTSIKVTLARRLHDFSITDAIDHMIEGEKIVAIMGGHGLLRTDPMYAAVARIARSLTRAGFLLASGGGPGAMEATHLGAYLAGHDDDALAGALELLAPAPLYKPVPEWLEASFRVVDRYEERGQSLGIPTWLYGQEPPSIFASHIAKYFANSVREDGLLAIAKAGVVFAPGSAGTIQEVFQDACQNHYITQEIASPMIFFGKDCWLRDKPVYPLLAHLAAGRDYALHLAVTDDEDEVLTRLTRFAEEAL